MTTHLPPALRSMAQLFRTRLLEDGDRPAARFKTAAGWTDLTWSQLAARGEALAWGLFSLGAGRGQKVGLIGATRIEWTLCDLGVMHTGATSVPVYHSNTPEEIRFILDNAGASICFVENALQLKKMQEIKARLPQLSRVIVMDGEGPPADGWVLSLQQLEELGRAFKANNPGMLDAALAAQQPSDLHALLYTSGTTGEPKGVMITNDNMLFAADCSVSTGLLTREQKHLMFLPFAHVFAQVIKCGWFGSGLTQIFAESPEKLVENAGQTAPTCLSAVPRIYEKVFGATVASAMAAKGIKGMLQRMALREFDKYAHAREHGQEHSSLLFSFAKKSIYPKFFEGLKAKLGGSLQQLVSGGAPLSKKIGYFFDLLGFDMLEGYGLTETTAITSVNLPGQLKVGSVGRAFQGIEVKIAPDGEILERGRNIMAGYYNKPEATAEAIDAEGWFHTGDIGALDSNGFLTITDRKKDLIKTSGGKYIAPQAIEGALKTSSELISQVVVIGEGHKYVSVLLTVVEDVARKLAQAAGEPATTYAELAKAKSVHSKVQETVARLNAQLASYEQVKRFTILDRDFSQDSGELTPTMKVKRKACTAKFKAQIDAMYADEHRV